MIMLNLSDISVDSRKPVHWIRLSQLTTFDFISKSISYGCRDRADFLLLDVAQPMRGQLPSRKPVPWIRLIQLTILIL